MTPEAYYSDLVTEILHNYSSTTIISKTKYKAGPEWPDVSIAVPKKNIFSVREAWTMHTEAIKPPGLIKNHCSSDAGKMCPGYLALRSLWTFSNAFFTSNGPVAPANRTETSWFNSYN